MKGVTIKKIIPILLLCITCFLLGYSYSEKKNKYIWLTDGDLITVKEYILEKRTPTQEEINKYDFNQDNHIGATDLWEMKKILIKK